jgi:hypothetical protein
VIGEQNGDIARLAEWGHRSITLTIRWSGQADVRASRVRRPASPRARPGRSPDRAGSYNGRAGVRPGAPSDFRGDVMQPGQCVHRVRDPLGAPLGPSRSSSAARMTPC